jgi:transposase
MFVRGCAPRPASAGTFVGGPLAPTRSGDLVLWVDPTASLPPDAVPCASPNCQQLLRDLRRQAGYYQALHQRACCREATLKAQHKAQLAQRQAEADQRCQQLQRRVADLEAEVRLLKQRLYGRSSEAGHRPNTLATDPPPANPDATPRRRRGQQPGRPSHGRRCHDHLPTTHETIDLPPQQRHCSGCGLPLAPCGSEPRPGTLIEVSVKAHRRVIRRRRYRPTCACTGQPALIVAPPPPRLLPNTALGVSVWVLVLLDKYAFGRPTHRLLAQLREHGLDLAPGTLTDGLQRLLPLLEPVYEALIAHNRQQAHWHGDETRWLVFATVEGKVGHLWYLWLVMSAQAAVFVMASGRSHDVPEQTLGPQARGIFNADRYSAYPAMQQVKDGQITLALCWAHQRRDFIEAERSRPELNDWASAWLARISELYRLNEARLVVWQKDAAAFAVADGKLRAALVAMEQAAATELGQAKLSPTCRGVLESLQTHWAGLTVFVEHPEVPMDNNAAERAERGPVVGRKNYYGSGAVWSGQLAAVMFSVVQTLRLWGLSVQGWLTGYLRACAERGGRAPQELRPWLPWQMTEAERAEWRVPGATQRQQAPDSS